MKTNATAAIGITRRRGLGKIRHLATADLWVQDRLRAKDFTLEKVSGHDNIADLLTKHLDRPTLLRHLDSMGLVQEECRSALAPHIEG